MISYDQACAAIAALPLRGGIESIPLWSALGRISTHDLRLDQDQPSFDRATMDGFAVALAPGTTRFRIITTVTAGEAWNGVVAPGEAVAIMTGASCPAGTTVVASERTRVEGNMVHCDAAALLEDRNIARMGEDGRCGEVVVPALSRLTPTTIAAGALCGVRSISVHVMPRWCVVTTGNEVGDPGRAGIRDTNGPFLESFAMAMHCGCHRTHARDEARDLVAALEGSRCAAEVIITTGGVSGSATDLMSDAAAAAGFSVVFHQVSMQPGKPVLVAEHEDGRLLVGLPGNPVSVVATAHLILLPVVGRLLGGWTRRWHQLPLAAAHLRPGRRQQFLPARLQAHGVEVVPWNGSGDLIAAATADGLVDLPAGLPLDAGASVRFLPYLSDSAGGTSLLARGERS